MVKGLAPFEQWKQKWVLRCRSEPWYIRRNWATGSGCWAAKECEAWQVTFMWLWKLTTQYSISPPPTLARYIGVFVAAVALWIYIWYIYMYVLLCISVWIIWLLYHFSHCFLILKAASVAMADDLSPECAVQWPGFLKEVLSCTLLVINFSFSVLLIVIWGLYFCESCVVLWACPCAFHIRMYPVFLFLYSKVPMLYQC